MPETDILLVTGDYAEDYEVMVPFQALQVAGHTVDAVCPDKSEGDSIVTAVHQPEGHQTYTERQGHNFTLNASFSEVSEPAYDALLLPGGRAPEYLRTDDRVLDLVQSFDSKEKPIAAICHAAQVLAAAGVLEGRSCSAFEAVAPEVEQAGGEFVDPGPEGAVIDDNLVTAPAWPAHPAWITKFLEVLGTKIEP